MGKTEMSSVLKNLKFMQRAAQKEEKIKEVEKPMPDGNFIPPNNVNRKCVVILEGEPQPGTVRGRMSFQNFNPSIDKLKDEAANGHEAVASTSSAFQSGRSNERENKPSERCSMEMSEKDANGELKRKQPKEFSQAKRPKKLQKCSQGKKQPSPSDNCSSQKQTKHDKLNFNVLVPQKSHSKRNGR